MLGLARVALALFFVWLLGALLLGGLGVRRRRWPLGYAQPAMDFAVGAAVLATLWTFAALFGWTMRRELVWVAALVLAIPAGIRAGRQPRNASEETKEGPASNPRTAWAGWLALLALVVVLAGISARAYAISMFWDGRYIWAFKAKAMFADERLDREAFSNLARYRYTHFDYPLSVPAVQAWVYQTQGHVDERRAKLVGIVYWLGIVALLAGYLRRRMTLPWALGLSLLACQVSVVAYHAGGGAADVPQAFHFLAGGVLLADWAERGRREDSLMAALMFGTGTLVKAEGLSMALGGALAFAAAWGWRLRQTGLGEVGLGFLAVGLPYLPWAALRVSWGIPSLQLTRSHFRPWPQMWERLALTIKSSVAELVAWSRWELAGPVILLGFIAYLFLSRRERAVGLLWGLLIWQYAVYVAVYLFSALDITLHLTTSLSRLLIHLMPLGMAAAVASLIPTPASTGEPERYLNL